MNALLESLAGAARKYRLEQKILIVNDLHAGHALLEALAKESVPWLNITPMTPFLLAKTALGTADDQIAEPGQLMFFIGDVLAQMESRGELQYFAPLNETGDLRALLFATVQELRLSGIKAQDLDPASFVNRAKGGELKTLLAGYERKLDEHKLLDWALLYQRALKSIDNEQTDNHIFLIPKELDFPLLVYRFIDKLTAGTRIVLAKEAVHNLKRPACFHFTGDDNPGDESRLSYLYDVPAGGHVKDPEIEMFAAYGAANEVREVFRRLKREKIPADRALLCCTNRSLYIPLILSQSSRLGLPITFAEGIPLRFTRPGRLALRLVSWIEGNYSVSSFYRLLISGDVKIEQGEALGRLLRESEIGWGRERYLPCLAKKVDARQQDPKEENGASSYVSRRNEQFSRLQELMIDILDRIPPPDSGQVDFPGLCRGLAEIVRKYSRVTGKFDALALEALDEELKRVATAYPENLPERTAVARLKANLEALYIGAEGPQPNHLHVVTAGRVLFSHRPYTFVLGLDAASFPGSGLQDPVLLDREREAVSPVLPLRSRQPERNLYRFATFLASLSGKVVFSYPSFSVAEGRTNSPSSLLLQVYRLISNEPEADYSRLVSALGAPVSYSPPDPQLALTEEEWWLATALGGFRATDLESVKACYPGIERGCLARELRMGNVFTAYDGRIETESAELDPRKNRQTILSATQLEFLAGCPFAYFLRYVLKVKTPEELEYNPAVWLDARSRGLLLHRIYAEYLRSNRDLPLSMEELQRKAAVLIEETKEQVPPPSSVVYEYERRLLERSLTIFFKMEEELRKDGGEPFALEVPFGFDKDELESAGLGQPGPVDIALGGGETIRLRGRIDRIDRMGDGSYRIWDYKTGGTAPFSDNEYVKQGQQLQHALYAAAAEVILKGEVKQAGYLFPTEKGEGRRFVRDQDRRWEAFAALEKMLNLLGEGAFPATHDKDRCKFCDYALVCRSPEAVEQTQVMLANEKNTVLKAWEELQRYE